MTTVLHLLLQETESLHGFSGYAFTLLLEVTLKGTLFLSVAAILSLALRRASAASRHLVWTLALGAILALPVLALTLPAWKVPVFSLSPSFAASEPMATKEDFAEKPQNPLLVQRVVALRPPSPAWPDWFLFLWGIGSIFFVARMAVGDIRVRRLARRSQLFESSQASANLENVRQRLHISRSLRLRTSGEIGIPFTRGVFRPAIFLPEESRVWLRRELEFVLAHELAHVHRHDSLTQMLAQITCALVWFHPLVWLAAVQMRKERERACDDLVLNLGHPATDYGEFLFSMGRSQRGLQPAWSTGISMAQSSQLEVRMKALLNPRLNHRPLAARTVTFAAILTIALLLPAVAIHANTKEPTGSITGTVFGPGREALSGAKATLTDLRTLKQISASTDEDGQFEFSNTMVGGYRLEITKPGFKPVVFPGIAVASSRGVQVYVNVNPLSEGKASPPPHAPERIRLGRQVAEKKLTYRPPFKYPPLARKAGIQGTVKLDAVINKDGTVKELKVLSGRPLLVKAALDAVKKWRFKPTLVNGVPVEVETTIVVNFGLAQVSDGGSGE